MSCVRCRRIEYYSTILLLVILLVCMYSYLYNARHHVLVSYQTKARAEEVFRTGNRKGDENLSVSDNRLAVDGKIQTRGQVDKPRIVAKHDKQDDYKDRQQADNKPRITEKITAKHDKQEDYKDLKDQDPQQVNDKPKIDDKHDKPRDEKVKNPQKVNDKPRIAAKQDGQVNYKDPQLVDDTLNEMKSNLADRKVPQGKAQVDEKTEDDKSIVGKEKLQANNGNIDPVMKMRGIVSEINKNEVVLNDDKFPSFDLVMIIQVHRRLEYLKMLLESLRGARDISEVLLVVSFDYYNEELFSVVDKVDFCKVVKIVFPKLIQLYPNEFPGDSPDACPRDISQAKAKEQGCIDADHPDSYGHYREAAITAIKHHWWWKINHIFDEMKVTADYNGFVIFLEEDLYVAPDIVPVTKQLISLRDQHCQDCTVIGLGLATHMSENLQISSGKVDIMGWWNNLAYAIDRQFWNDIKKCSKQFCTFDDYNWDWTMCSLQHSCYHKTMKTISLKAPRAYHIGTCGIHQVNHGDSNCNWNEAVDRVKAHITTNKQYYFPVTLSINGNHVSPYSYRNGYGGWGDPRDHALCLSFVHDK